MAVSLTISITQNSQNVSANTSNVTVTATAKWTGGSHNRTGECHGYLTIDGTVYDFTGITFNDKKTPTGSKTVMTWAVTVRHNTNGTKTLKCTASFYTGVSSGTIGASASKTLTTIARKSTLSVANGTLGTPQDLTITKQSSSYTHTIVATCGSAKPFTICTKSPGTIISFTPDVEWASQNTTGTSVSVKYVITSYAGDTNLGSNSYTRTCAIPATVKPGCSISVSDGKGYASTYGKYIKGLSTFKVTVGTSAAYNSPIAAYSTTANGSTYTAASFTTAVLKSSGTLSISATVKDKRGRSGTDSKSVSVYDYSAPSISDFKVERCNSDGKTNASGAYMKVTFGVKYTSLDNQNKITYVINYKKSADSSYISKTVTTSPYIFAAETGSSYNVALVVSDNFYSGNSARTKSVTAPSAFTLWSILKDSGGFAIGKIAELKGYLDIGFQTMFRDHAYFANDKSLFGKTTDGVDCNLVSLNYNNNTVFGYGGYANSIGSTNIYGNNISVTSKNAVTISAPTILTHGGDADGTSDTTPPLRIGSPTGYHIAIDGNEIMAKSNATTTGYLGINSNGGNVEINGCLMAKNAVLWSGGHFMSETHTATLSKAISKQANGVVLVWSYYKDGAVDNSAFNMMFIPKHFVSAHNSKGVSMSLNSATGHNFAFKYLYVSDTQIVGYENNDAAEYTTNSGIISKPTYFVLRYVIGV